MKTKFLPVLLILSGLLITADKSYACNDPPNADLDASPNPVCVGDSVTIDGSGSSDPDGEITKYEWDWTNDGEYDYEETPGDGIATHIYTIAGTYTAKLRVTDDDGATDTDTCTVTVIRAKIVSSPYHLLVYTGSHAGDQPTRMAIASGEPKGGTFSWSYEKSGTGDIEFVEFFDGPPGNVSTQMAEIKGIAQSSVLYDVELKVTYTLDGTECEAASKYTTVRRPKTTTAYAGDWYIGPEDNKHYRKYYHVVACQFGYLLDDIGIPFDEVVTPECSWTSPGATNFHQPDCQGYGQWFGGVAVLDKLGCPPADHAEFHQQLLGGGWQTTPEFNIYFQPTGYPPLCPTIWKEIDTE
jgi:PKD repeat protein